MTIVLQLPAETLPRLIEIELGGADSNAFRALAHAPSPAATLSAATGGELERSVRHRELKRPHGFGDELRAVLNDDGATWGALKHVRGGLFTVRRPGRPHVRLRLLPLDVRGRARLDLTLSRVRTRDVRALCAVLPAGVSRAGRPLELETRLRVRDRGVSGRVSMRQPWRCVRDRKGEFAGIRPVAARPPAARPGLHVRLRAPRLSASARRLTVRVTVANRRRGRSGRVASSLWNLRISGSAGGRPHTVRVKELRAHRARTVRFSVRVPRDAGRRTCVRVTAAADSARAAGTRRCVRLPGAPGFTG